MTDLFMKIKIFTFSKMGNTGCLISCVATAITNLNVPITPKELNAALTEKDGFLVSI